MLKTLSASSGKPREARSAAGEHDAGGDLRYETRAAQFVANEHQQFVGARLD